MHGIATNQVNAFLALLFVDAPPPGDAEPSSDALCGLPPCPDGLHKLRAPLPAEVWEWPAPGSCDATALLERDAAKFRGQCVAPCTPTRPDAAYLELFEGPANALPELPACCAVEPRTPVRFESADSQEDAPAARKAAKRLRGAMPQLPLEVWARPTPRKAGSPGSLADEDAWGGGAEPRSPGHAGDLDLNLASPAAAPGAPMRGRSWWREQSSRRGASRDASPASGGVLYPDASSVDKGMELDGKANGGRAIAGQWAVWLRLTLLSALVSSTRSLHVLAHTWRAWAPRGEALAAALRAAACIALAFALPCPASPSLTLGTLIPWRSGRLGGVRAALDAGCACLGASLARLDAGVVWRASVVACLALHALAVARRVYRGVAALRTLLPRLCNGGARAALVHARKMASPKRVR
ncbi:hypothetical protein WJX81_003962 [Elliptochloris bilobata]|uniref:Uncharacterized protein n=1 Tax=Elliptochloris bilobata TaxID=381761 RepID=A0AAW1RCK9_9CHLO